MSCNVRDYNLNLLGFLRLVYSYYISFLKLFYFVDMSKKSNLEEFKNKFYNKFPNNKLEILEYVNCENILVKDEYGIYKITANHLLNGYFPTIQTAVNKTECFIKKAKSLHSDKYDYSLVDYKLSNLYIKIICPIHGLFEQRPNDHLKPCGCKKCADLNNSPAWTKTYWFKTALISKNFDSFKVYILEMWNENERFYKIGRTFNNVKRRYSSNKKSAYNFKIIKTFEFKELTQENAIKCYDLETKLKQINKKHKYLPQINFGGMYECFKIIKYE